MPYYKRPQQIAVLKPTSGKIFSGYRKVVGKGKELETVLDHEP